MPRFSQADEAFLKRTMLPRVPACFYTPEDLDLIMKETGMEKGTILHWAANLRWRAGINQLSGSMGLGVEEFLKTSPDVVTEKVIYHKPITFCHVTLIT